MAVNIKLEKDGFKKDAYVGFSWTTLFLGIWVPSFRLDLKGFLVFLGLDVFKTAFPAFLLINYFKGGNPKINLILFFSSILFNNISNFILAIFYNKIYTRNMLLDGWRPMDNDDYSLAILNNYGFIEYNVDALDEEKIEKYREYVSDAKSAERRKWICFILPLIHIILTMVMLVIGIFTLLAYIEQAR